MIIKHFVPRNDDIAELKRLSELDCVSGQQRAAIEKEIKLIEAGDRNEQQTAYELELKFKMSQNHALIHGLRLDVDGDVAQIDHLVITRFLDIFVIESKSFSGGVAINEEGEFTAFHNGKPMARPSPIVQNDIHCMILKRAIEAKKFRVPTRLGIPIRAKIRPIVLIGNKNRITRPRKKFPELKQVMKAEKFLSYFSKEMEKINLFDVAKMFGIETLTDFATSMVEQHPPITVNWAARFGIEEPVETLGPTCETCGTALDQKVVNWCKMNTKAFDGRLLCREHQPKVPSRWGRRTVTSDEETADA